MITEKVITIQGRFIHICTTSKRNRAIIFVHGNSSSAGAWNMQLNDTELAQRHQLISFDLPGHGKSGKSLDYSLKQLAKTIPGLVKALDVQEYIIVSLSYGTCLVAEAAPELAGCKGYMMVSANLVSNDYPPTSFLVPHPALQALVAAEVSNSILNEFVNLLVLNNTALANEYGKSYLQTDTAFRVSLGKVIASGDWSDELANLHNAGVPVCIVFGKEEKAIKTDYLDDYNPKWRNKVFLIENAAHFPPSEQPGLFNKLLMEFADEAFK